MLDVFVIGAGMTRFAKHLDRSIKSLAEEALDATLADAGLEKGAIQTAYFAPKGLAGFLYWYLLYPIHSLIFSGLIKTLVANIEHKAIDNSQSNFDVAGQRPEPVKVHSNDNRVILRRK